MDEYIAFAQAHPLLVFGFFIILGIIVWMEFNRFTRKYQSLNVNEAVRLLNNDDTICIDVREDRELTSGSIKNATHIPLGQLKTRLADYANKKSQPFLVYCRSGSRSAHACSEMTKQGFENVSNLTGGIMAWETANLPLTKKKK